MEDTIAGVSTAVGNAGLAVIRMSGEKSFEIADKVFREEYLSQPRNPIPCNTAGL